MNTTNLASPCPFVTPANLLARAGRTAGAVRFSELATQKIRWLWPDRIPLGRITLLVSDPGLGKSLLALDIAARVTTAAPWPDSQPSSNPQSEIPNPQSPSPASVLLLTAEDDFADTVRPRLEALGADLNRILGIATIPGDDPNDVPRAFALTRDIARLRDLLDAMPDCRLIIIDPISAYLGRTNEHSNADVQSLLASLTTIARERNIAILAVSHLRKKDGAAVYRPMGSLAFIAASHDGWAICKDPTDPSKRLFLPVKNNLAPTACGLAFAIESHNGMPQIRWSPEPINQSLEFAIAATRAAHRPDEEREYAKKWLTERLAESPYKATVIREEAEVQGISYGTLRRAFRDIGGKATRKGKFPIINWYWCLPGQDAQKSGGEFCASSDNHDEFADFFKPFMPPNPSAPSTND